MIEKIIEFLCKRGLRFSRERLNEIIDYLDKMWDENRLLVLADDNNEIILFCAFSMGNDFNVFYNKKTWEFVEHNPKGRIAYLEKLVTNEFKKEFSHFIRSEIQRRFPDAKTGVWHRPTVEDDRKFIYHPTEQRKFKHVYN